MSTATRSSAAKADRDPHQPRTRRLIASTLTAALAAGALTLSTTPALADHEEPGTVSYDLRTRLDPLVAASGSIGSRGPTFSPDGTRIYVLHRFVPEGGELDRDHLQVLDAQTGEVLRDPVLVDPSVINFTHPRVSASGDIYLGQSTNPAVPHLRHIDPVTFEVTELPAPSSARFFAPDPDGGMWVLYWHGAITHFTGTTPGATITFTPAANPFGLGYDAEHHRLWVGEAGGGAAVRVFDAGTGEELIEPDDLSPDAAARQTLGLFVDEARGRVLVLARASAGGGAAWLRVYDSATLERLSETQVHTGNQPLGAAYDYETGALVFGGLVPANVLRVVDTTVDPPTVRQNSPSIQVNSIAVNPVNGDLLVLNNDTATIGAPLYTRHWTPPLPDADEGEVDLEVVIPEDDGPDPDPVFEWTIQGTGPVSLGEAVAIPAGFIAMGDLHRVQVTDTRVDAPAWSINGVAGDFTSGDDSFGAQALGWLPGLLDNTVGAVAGAQVVPIVEGLAQSRTLVSAPAGHELGSVTVVTRVDLLAPSDTAAGDYVTTLTLTAVG